MKVVVGTGDAVLDAIGEQFKTNPGGWMGPLYVGAVVDFFFMGILCCQVLSYYRFFPKDSSWVKKLVAFVFLISIAKSIISFLVIWDKNIVGFGDWRIAASVPWSIWSEVPVAYVMTTAAQTFFVWRCFTLTGRNWYLFGMLVTLMLTVVGFSVIVGLLFAIDPFNAGPIRTYAVPMLVGSFTVDIIITAVVSYKLIRSQKGFSNQTDTVLKKLLAITWESAAPPTINQIINVIVFITTASKSSWHGPINMLTPRLYIFSLLYTLNSRATIRMQSSQGTSGGHEVSHGGGLGHTTGGARPSHVGNVLALSTFAKKDRTTSYNPTGTMPVHIQTETIVHTSSADAHAPAGPVEVEVHKLNTSAESVDSSRWENSDKVTREEDEYQHPYNRYVSNGYPVDSKV
jgi:hypothetical protein